MQNLLEEGSKYLQIFINNKTFAPPTYIFHGPPPNMIAAKTAQKKVNTTKNHLEQHKSSRYPGNPRYKKCKIHREVPNICLKNEDFSTKIATSKMQLTSTYM